MSSSAVDSTTLVERARDTIGSPIAIRSCLDLTTRRHEVQLNGTRAIGADQLGSWLCGLSSDIEVIRGRCRCRFQGMRQRMASQESVDLSAEEFLYLQVGEDPRLLFLHALGRSALD